MKALTVVPGKSGSAGLSDVPPPPESDGPVVVDTQAVGVCGTDLEIVSGEYGWAPPGQDRLTLGHESLGRVNDAPPGSGFAVGDWVVGIVRRPDPVPCPNCAVGEWDFCKNDQYTERGIKHHDGYLSEQYRITPDFLIKLDPSLGSLGVLLEPTSVLAKAWDQVDRIGSRARWDPHRALVTGAGPIGLLAALIGVQRGLEVHVLDQVTSGPKPDLVQALGAQYHAGVVKDVDPADVVIECTGAPSVVFDAVGHTASGGVVCLTGVSPEGRSLSIDAGLINRELVLENEVVVGSVNANRGHYETAAKALAAADHSWLARLITRRVPLEDWQMALSRQPDDIKVVIEVNPA